MSSPKYIGRVGALAVALGFGNFRRAATWMTVSIGAAVLVVTATAVPMPGSTVSPAVRLAASSAPCARTDVTCALILGTTTISTPNDYYIDVIKDQDIAPTHPVQDIEYVAVTTPQEAWPLTGILRFAVLGLQQLDPHLAADKGLAWPDEPWWKLSGLFDLTWDQAIQAGVADLEQAMATHGNDHLVIYGYGQSAVVANLEKRKLATQYPKGTEAPDINFVVGGDPNLPNGGLFARFPGLYLPIIDISFNGPAPTDTQFHTDVISRQYDGVEDFPLYPINVVADLNALLGTVYVGLYGADVSLAPDASKSPAFQGTHGDTSYYFFPTEDLPLFGPLRTLGVPEPAIDVVEPVFRDIVELGYDRSIPPWEPTPARPIHTLDPATVAADLLDAIGQGITNAAALVGAPAPLGTPADITGRNAAVEQHRPAPGATLKRIIGDVNDGVAQGLAAVRSQLLAAPAVTQHDLDASQRTVGRELAATRDQIHQTLGAVKSVIGDGRTIVRSAGNDNGSPTTTAGTGTAHKTSVRDAVRKAGGDIKKVVTKVSDRITKALHGGKADDHETGDGGEGAAQ
jgi:PE-PPE domain